MVDYVDAALFNNDSLDKQIHIVSSDSTVNLGNDDLISESFQLIESLCSEECLMFGAVEPRIVKFSVKYSAPRLLNKWLTITMTLHGSQTPFEFGDYKVLSDKPSSDRTTRDVTAYSHYHGILKNTYKSWYKNAWGNSDTMTIKQFRDSFFERLHSKNSWVVQETTSLPNDNAVIKKSKNIPRISGKDILNAICEINGVFGYIDRDNVFRYKRLNNSNTTYSIGTQYTISAEYEDYTTVAIDRVEILAPDGSVMGEAGATDSNSQNKYVVGSNFMLKGLGKTNSAKDTYQYLATHLLDVIKTVTYIPFDAEFKGNPCFEVGDRISFTAHGATKTSYILQRTMKGIQSLHDNYTASGEEKNDSGYSSSYGGGTASVISNKFQELEEQIGDIPVSDFNLVQNDDKSITFQSINDIDSDTVTRKFNMWEHNFNEPQGYDWAKFNVSISMPYPFVICTIPDLDHGNPRYYYLDGKWRQSKITYVVAKLQQSVGDRFYLSGQSWVKYAGYFNYYNEFSNTMWKRENTLYYYSATGTGTLMYGLLDIEPDYSFNSYAELWAAMAAGTIDVPGVVPDDECTLATESSAKQAAANAEYLAEKMAGNNPSRSSETYIGNVNVFSEGTMSRLSTALYNMGDNVDNLTAEMTGATAQAAGEKGLVPTPAAGDNEKFLRGDGTWQEAAGGNDVGLSVVNGAIDSTYNDDGTDVTADILKDSTGDEIVAVLDSIAEQIGLLNNPEVYAPIVYSDEEREIGVWTDGKPLYEKTVPITTFPNVAYTVKSYSHNIANIDKICDWNGVARWSSGSVAKIGHIDISNGSQVSSSAWFAAFVDKTDIKITTGIDRSAVSGEFTIRYTKTTDVAGSGHYAALGVPAVHYSENEQVIGTWVDGKTLYQKTFSGLSLSVPSMSWVDTGKVITNGNKCINVICNANTSGIAAIGDLRANESGKIYLMGMRNATVTLTEFTIQYTKTS